MLSAVTLSRSPPRAETTMVATSDRSRIWRHRSKPSTSGSIRSSSTMSGSSVSSSWRARMPSTDTTVSNPRTARLDLIRSTMLGSSSTTRAQVAAPSAIMAVRRQAHLEAGAAGARLQLAQLEAAAVRVDDALGDRQPEPRPGAAGSPPPDRLERGGGQLGGHPRAVVTDADDDLAGRPVLAG